MRGAENSLIFIFWLSTFCCIWYICILVYIKDWSIHCVEQAVCSLSSKVTLKVCIQYSYDKYRMFSKVQSNKENKHCQKLLFDSFMTSSGIFGAFSRYQIPSFCNSSNFTQRGHSPYTHKYQFNRSLNLTPVILVVNLKCLKRYSI